MRHVAQFLQASADLHKQREDEESDEEDDDAYDIDGEISHALREPAMFVTFCTDKRKRKKNRLLYFKVCLSAGLCP